MVRHETEETLSALLDGELTKNEAVSAAEHLGVCESCRKTFAGLRSAKQFVRLAARRPMPAGLAAELQRRVDGASVPAPYLRMPRVPWTRLVVPALTFATAAFMGGLWVWERSLNSGPEIPIEQLMAAHERYRDEGLLAAVDPAQADFTSTLATQAEESQGKPERTDKGDSEDL